MVWSLRYTEVSADDHRLYNFTISANWCSNTVRQTLSVSVMPNYANAHLLQMRHVKPEKCKIRECDVVWRMNNSLLVGKYISISCHFGWNKKDDFILEMLSNQSHIHMA